MLIVSEFHDYYDSVSSLGIDKQCPYQRKEAKFDLEPPGYRSWDSTLVKPSTSGTYRSRHYKYELKYRLIGFCGKIYPLIFVEKSGYGAETGLIETNFFYSANSLMDYLAKEEVGYRQWKSWWRRKYYSIEYNNGLDGHFDSKTWDHFLHYFQDHKTPVFLIGSKHLIINPCLKDFKFQQVKDTYTAFQDIYMYISGVLGVETKPTVEISDEDMAESKGHGGKYSFRKPPGKRGKNRWR